MQAEARRQEHAVKERPQLQEADNAARLRPADRQGLAADAL